MNEHLPELGRRLRALREGRGETAAQIARLLDLDEAAYQQVEAGTADLPVGSLLRLARHCGLGAGELLGDGSPHLRRFSVVRHGTGVPVERRAAYRYATLAPQFAGKQMEPFLVTVEPASAAAAAPCAHDGHEFDYVLEGTLEVTLDGHVVILQPGDALYFDATQRHAMHALNNAPARFLAVVTVP